MTNKTYDILASIQRLWLPSIATLLTALSQIWGWEAPMEQITLTIMAVDTFMGVVLKIQSDNYFENAHFVKFGDEAIEYEEEK